jgi:hypothetical protein
VAEEVVGKSVDIIFRIFVWHIFKEKITMETDITNFFCKDVQNKNHLFQ